MTKNRVATHPCLIFFAGPRLVQRFRPDLQRKFKRMFTEEGDDTVSNYVYHCNAQYPRYPFSYSSIHIFCFSDLNLPFALIDLLIFIICLIFHSLLTSSIKNYSALYCFSVFVSLFILSVVYYSSHSFTHSFVHSFINSFIRSLIHSFIHSFICSFIHSLIHSFIQFFIH